jgi:anti-sigma B factor antagonist
MGGKLEIAVERIGPHNVMHLKGDVTSFSDGDIRAAYKAMDWSAGHSLVIDFSGTRYINSAGVATLVGLVADITEKKGTLKFAGMAPHYRRVAEIVGITEYASFHESVEDALREKHNARTGHREV